MNLEKLVFGSKYLNDTLTFLKYYNREKIYVAAGVVAQTVWNNIYGNSPEYGVGDIDLIYFNNNDLSESSEELIFKDISNELRHLQIKIDIKNQARVHFWYKSKFGYDISPVKSIEDGINRFPVTATSIGINYNEFDKLNIYSPFGLDDLFSGIVRANKKQITEKIYYTKVNEWLKKWPKLQIIQW
jgi:hypothetical protein